jgi:ATP-dependent DNA ligase
LDGEVAAVDESGLPAFYDLMKQKRQAVYFAFDILWLNGKDCGICPCLSERKSYARSSLRSLPGLVRELYRSARGEALRDGKSA